MIPCNKQILEDFEILSNETCHTKDTIPIMHHDFNLNLRDNQRKTNQWIMDGCNRRNTCKILLMPLIHLIVKVMFGVLVLELITYVYCRWILFFFFCSPPCHSCKRYSYLQKTFLLCHYWRVTRVTGLSRQCVCFIFCCCLRWYCA